MNRSVTLLLLVFASVIGSFLVTTIVVQRTSSDIDALADRIVSNAMPSIERLAGLRSAALDAEIDLTRYIAAAEGRAREGLREEVEASRRTVDDEARRYLEMATLAGEAPYREEVEVAWRRLRAALDRARALADAGDGARAHEVVTGEVDHAAVMATDAAMRAIRFNAEQGRALASRVREKRQRAVWLASVLTAGCVVLGVLGALLVLRQERSRRAITDAHARSLESRAAELEEFAGRVAHDLRNPISSMKLAADVALDKKGRDEATAALARRVLRGAGRADAIIGGLLDFARSGARPDPGARCDVREVLDDMVAGLGDELAAANIELRVAPVPPVGVACSTGAYLSLAGNVVRNAIKYMRDRPQRRIDVRVIDDGALVRTEVEDTGPGIPAQLLPSLFEPYFRVSAERGRDGLGLGLATVKKLAEGHGGAAGVRSVVGEGSTFWFTLPRAGDAPDAGLSID